MGCASSELSDLKKRTLLGRVLVAEQDVCNIITFVMIGTLVVVSAVLIQRPKKIIVRLP
jgi:hypothetical protein